MYWLLKLFHWLKNPQRLKELLLVNERLGKILQLNNESLEMQRLAFFFFFFSSLIVPFVLVSIISLFGLADFQLEAASLGAELLQHSGGSGGGVWNCRRYGACTCDLLLGRERFCPSNVSPVEVGAMCCDRS